MFFNVFFQFWTKCASFNPRRPNWTGLAQFSKVATANQRWARAESLSRLKIQARHNKLPICSNRVRKNNSFYSYFLENSKNFVIFTKSSNEFGEFLSFLGFCNIFLDFHVFFFIFLIFPNFLEHSRKIKKIQKT